MLLTAVAPLPFSSSEYICFNAHCPDAKQFQAGPMIGERNWLYNTRTGIDHHLAVGDLVKRWMPWADRRAVLRRDVATCADLSLIRCMQEEAYVICLALIVRDRSVLTDAVRTTHSLEYV